MSMSNAFSLRNPFVLVALFTQLATHAGAQSNTTPSPNDSLFRRARRLVSEGNGAAGRALVDTLLGREQEGRPGYGDALYWRGALAETAADAERDYRRVIVEYPLSAYADDALLAMAELEQARGDRAAALQHLQRFVREHPVSTARGTAAFAGARLAFELGDSRAACALITDARSSIASSEVELRNQVDYYATRCPSSGAPTPVLSGSDGKPTPRDSIHAVPTRTPSSPTRRPKASVTMTPPAKIETVRPIPAADVTPSLDTVPTRAPADKKSKVMFTVQVAAYTTLAEATALVARLEKKGVHAHVSGVAKPYRVHLTLHPTRQAALDEAAALKAQSIVGFVTTEEQTAAPKTP